MAASEVMNGNNDYVASYEDLEVIQVDTYKLSQIFTHHVCLGTRVDVARQT